MVKPHFFIVGAPKSGTTVLNDYLSQHPDIFMAPKELHYFGKDLKTKLKLSEAEYLQNFREVQNEKVIGEASVWYLFSKTAAKEIKEFDPDAKIIIMLRNPVEVIYALHSQHLFDGNEDVRDFEEAINLDKYREKGERLPDSVDYFETPLYKDSVLFFAQVKRYLDAFNKDNVHIILYDDFVSNTEKTISDTFKFLEIRDDIPIQYKILNKNKRIKWFYLHRLIKKPPSWMKKIIRIILPFRSVRHFMMSRLYKWNINVAERDSLNTILHQQLKKDFANDIDSLGHLINKDLSEWK